MTRRLLLFIFLSQIAQNVCSQVRDSSVYKASLSYAVDYYNTEAAEQLPLFTGVIHRGHSPDIKGTPYYLGSEWNAGGLTYDKLLYKNVFLKFDTYNNELSIRNFNGQPVVLSNDKVERFNLGSQSFVYQRSDGSNGLPVSGFYRALFLGKVSAYAYYVSLIDKTLTNNIEREFFENTRYYILKENKWYQVQGLKSIVKIFNDRKSEMRQYIREHDMEYKASPERVLIELSGFYNSLN